MSKKAVIIASILAVLLVVIPFVCFFASTGISYKSADWTNFSSYVNGLLMPLLTIFNIVILAGVSKSISSISGPRKEHDKRIQTQMKMGEMADFRVDINKEETIEESISGIEEQLKDIFTLIEELSDKDDVDFETKCLAVPNKKARMTIEIAQLKVNIYQELFSNSQSPKHEELWKQAMKEMEKLHKETYLAD